MDRKNTILTGLCLAGFLAAVLAGLADHVEWLASLCFSFSQGCKQTAQYSLLRLPIWAWGAAFYLALAFVVMRRPQSAFWFAAGALGFDLALIRIMVASNALCIFCIFNSAVLFLIAGFCFERDKFWRMLSVTLLAFVVSIFIVPVRGSLLDSAPREKKTDVGKKDERNAGKNVVAVIAGRSITAEELNHLMATRLYNIEMDIYKAKREFLEQYIAQELLSREARQRGITLQQLVNELVPGPPEVTMRELEAYYRENRHKWGDFKGSEDELKARAMMALQQEKRYKIIMDYVRSLEPRYGVAVYLKEPAPPNVHVAAGNDPTFGPPDAPLTVVVFSDYQCPGCRKAHDTIETVRPMFEGKVKWVFKDYPIAGHKWSREAAEAARCAHDQGKFSEYQSVLFGSREEFIRERLVQYAGAVGMDVDEFGRCVSEERHKEDVALNMEEARAAGIDTTPTFIINGKLLPGNMPADRLKEIIDNELKAMNVSQ